MSARHTHRLQGLRAEQRALLAILNTGPATATQLATATERSERDIRASMQKLAARGLTEAGPLGQRKPGATDGQIPQTYMLTPAGIITAQQRTKATP